MSRLPALVGIALSLAYAHEARAEASGGDIARIVIASTLTAGGIAGTAVGGVLAADEVDTIEAHCPGRVCDRTGYDAVTRGQTAGGLATVSAFVAGASAVWLTIELVSLGFSEPEADPDDDGPKPLLPEKEAVRASIRPLPAGAGATLELVF